MSHSAKILNCIALALLSLLCGCSFDDPEIVIVELSPAQVHSTYEEDSEAHVDSEPGMLEARSGEWRAVRMAHIRDSPECIACGKRDQLYVHHIIPYQRYLCSGGILEAPSHIHLLLGLDAMRQLRQLLIAS